MRAADVVPAQAEVPPVDDFVVVSAIPGRLIGRVSSAGLAIFLRPWLAVTLVVLVVALPSYLITDVVFNDTNARLESSRLAEQSRAAETGAGIVAARVNGLRTDLLAVA